jgi:polyisoprenoid-binding protein YceI
MTSLLTASLALSLISALPDGSADTSSPVALELRDLGGARADTYLRFVLHSRKAGFINTAVEGYVRDFHVSYEWTGDAARRAQAHFATRELRTDNSGRDEKMWTRCLDADRYPEIEVQLDGDVPVGRSVDVPGRIRIRGAWHSLRLSAHVQRAHGTLVLGGEATVKLSELDIPDPSIWIAKVDDTVQLVFQAVTPAPASDPNRWK